MKKLIFAAAAVAGMGAFALESANVVGYADQTANAKRNTMMTPNFLNIDSTTGCKLSDLKVTGYDAPALNEDDEYEGGCGHGEFVLQFLANNGAISSRYYWVDDGETGPAWYDRTANLITEEVPINAGVSAWVIGSGYSLQSSGSVNTKDVAFKMNDKRQTAAGNCMPVDLTLAKLTVSGYEAPALNEDDEYEGGCGHGEFVLQFLKNDGSIESRYYWVDDGETGPAWCDRSGAVIDATKVPVPAGKGAWIIGSGYTLNIPAPTL